MTPEELIVQLDDAWSAYHKAVDAGDVPLATELEKIINLFSDELARTDPEIAAQLRKGPLVSKEPAPEPEPSWPYYPYPIHNQTTMSGQGRYLFEYAIRFSEAQLLIIDKLNLYEQPVIAEYWGYPQYCIRHFLPRPDGSGGIVIFTVEKSDHARHFIDAVDKLRYKLKVLSRDNSAEDNPQSQSPPLDPDEFAKRMSRRNER